MDNSLRLFYALWPDAPVRKALSDWQKTLSGRKTPPQNLHITLAFLGEQPADTLDELKGIVKLLSFETILLTLDKTGYFAHNRISWAGMQHVPDGLLQLHQDLVFALEERQISFDRRNRFTPHVTLARHSDRPRARSFDPVLWHASHLVLVESRTVSGFSGSRQEYVVLAEKKSDLQSPLR